MAKAFRLSCITKNGTNPAYEGARVGVTRVVEGFGGTVDHGWPSIPDDTAQQQALIEAALERRPDAMILAPTHPTALNDVIGRVVDAGIPLVCFVSAPSGLSPQCFVTADNYTVGVGIAEYLIAAIGGQGNLVMIEGSPQSPTSPPRTRGFIDAVEKHPGAMIIAQGVGHYQCDDARAVMADILDRQANIDGVLCANDFMALGVIQAMEAANRQCPIIGINAMPEAIQAIKAGKLLATAAFDAMKMASIAAEAALRVLGGKGVPSVIELPVDIVDGTNCDIWDLPYEMRPLPVWDHVVGQDS